jgi:DNA-binding HxlR family transcriptional regulator
MDSDGLNFDDPLKANDLVPRTWEAGVLWCRRACPTLYADIGNWLAPCSGLRPSDSSITRAVKRLERDGLVGQADRHEYGRSTYAITEEGRNHIAGIATLAGVLDEVS